MTQYYTKAGIQSSVTGQKRVSPGFGTREVANTCCTNAPYRKCTLTSFFAVAIVLLIGLTMTAAAAVPPTPTNPTPGTTSAPGPVQASTSVTLSWSASTGATSYSLGVRDVVSGVLVVDTTTSNTSYQANLAAGGQYRWNVAACNSSGCSSFTTPLYFQTPAVIPPTPTNPTPGTTSAPGPVQASTSVTLS